MRGLILVLTLQMSQPTVAVIIGTDRPPVIMTIREAETLLALETDHRIRAALEIALGSSPANVKEQIVCEGHKPLCDTIRGRRVPLQGID